MHEYLDQLDKIRRELSLIRSALLKAYPLDKRTTDHATAKAWVESNLEYCEGSILEASEIVCRLPHGLTMRQVSPSIMQLTGVIRERSSRGRYYSNIRFKEMTLEIKPERLVCPNALTNVTQNESESR